MAWQDMQRTMKLVSALTELGKDGGGHQQKGAQKGAGKGVDKKSWCQWKTCTAAQQGRPTLGGKVNCFCCNTHFSKTPPLEQLVDWAYQQKLQAAKDKPKADQSAQAAEGKGKGKGKNKGKGKGKDKGDSSKGKGKGKGNAQNPPKGK